jgi:metal-responsive CopG/Arc/MetJ family transcriptional regulator
MTATSFPISMDEALKARLEHYMNEHEEITRSGLISKLVRKFLDEEEAAF